MNLYLHYTRQPNPGDDPALDAVPTYALGHFARNHKGELLLQITSNARTTDHITLNLLHGQSILDTLRDVDGNPTRPQATGINTDEDEALLAEAQAQGWRVAAAY